MPRQDILIREGDIVSITNSYGLTGKELRIIALKRTSNRQKRENRMQK